MKNIYSLLFLVLFLCNAQSNTMQRQQQQLVLDCDKDFTQEELSFELYCRGDNFVVPDKKLVLQYVSNPNNDVNKRFVGPILWTNGAAVHPWMREFTIKDQFRQPCLHQACMNGDTKIIDCLLNRQDVNVNERNRFGMTPIHYAENVTTMNLLLNHGADVNNVCNDGRTTLDCACHLGRCSLIQLLLAQENIIIRKNTFFEAAKKSNGLLNAFLNSGKVKLNKKNDQKQTWFYVAWHYKTLNRWYSGYQNTGADSLDIFEQFDDNQRKLFLDNELRALSQMYSVSAGKSSCRLGNFIRFCIGSGADVQMRDEQGKRPVDQAYKNYSKLRKLLGYGNEESIRQEIIFHALLLQTPPISDENEKFAVERSVTQYLVNKEYGHYWNKSDKKRIRREILAKLRELS